MKKSGRKLKVWSALLAFCMTTVLSAGTVAKAAEPAETENSYKVTFRPGPDATFDLDSLSGDYEVKQATGSVVYTVKAGDPMPSVPDVVPGTGLYVLNDWYEDIAAAGSTVEGNMEFVVLCGELINAVEYTVRYVDGEGVDVSTPTIHQTNLGESVTVLAKTVEGYRADAASKQAVISQDGMEIRFVYTSTTPGETVENIVDEYVDGGTVDQVQTQYVNAPTAGGGAAGDGGAGAAGDAGDAGDAGEVTVPDEEVPLAPGATDDGTVDIEDEDVPLASGNVEDEGMSPVMWAVLGVAVVAALAGFWFVNKKKNTSEEE